MLPVLRRNASDGAASAENTGGNEIDGGVVNLSNAGDEVALLADANTIHDIVAWLTEDIQGLRTFGKVVPAGVSLQRWPADSDTDDCAADFRLQTIPSPGRVP